MDHEYCYVILILQKNHRRISGVMQTMSSYKCLKLVPSTNLVELDLKYFAGTVVVSASVILLAIQALNPCSILGGLLYSLVGLILMKNSKTGTSIIRSIPDKLVSSIQYNICNAFEEGSISRMILEISFAFILLSRKEHIAKSIVDNISSKPALAKTNNNIVSNVIYCINNNFPDMLKRSKGCRSHLFKEMALEANKALVQEIKNKSLRWIETNILRSIKRLRSFLYLTWINIWRNRSFQEHLEQPNNTVLAIQAASCSKNLPPMIQQLINPFMSQSMQSYQQLYVRFVAMAIILSNMLAFRFGVHPRRTAWLRNIIMIKLIAINTSFSSEINENNKYILCKKNE